MGIYPSISPIEEKGEKILKIEIEKSPRPISYRGRYYKRVGNTTREMQGEELITFFQQWSSWDTLTDNYSIDEIDEETVNKFIKRAVNSGRLFEDESESLIETLERLRLVKNGKLTNAAIMLFGKNPQKYFINAISRVGRFKDEITIIGDTIIEGNLFQQAEMAEKAVKSNINVKYEIEELVRKDIWDYPLKL